MIDAYPDTFVAVEYHLQDSYSYPWGGARAGFYDVWGFGIPFFVLDGLSSVYPIGEYQAAFLQRRMVPAEMTIDIAGEQISSATWRFDLEITTEPTWQARAVRVYAVQVLDDWPCTPVCGRNTFKQAAATEDLVLQPGASTTIVRGFTLDADSLNQIEDVKIAAWVQEPLPAMPAEIFQGAISIHPFIPDDPADVNGDGMVDVLDMLLVLAAWGAGSGPEDVNGDGIVNVLDLLEVLGNWS
jgi:hypothetical protein